MADSPRALTSAEKNNSQLERPCLGIVFGFEKNHSCLLGRLFAIYSDHKTILSILNERINIVSVHTERLILCLQAYDFKITHISSDENISDYSSRLPFAHTQENNQYLKEYISFVCKNACSKALNLDDIIQATKNLRN